MHGRQSHIYGIVTRSHAYVPQPLLLLLLHAYASLLRRSTQAPTQLTRIKQYGNPSSRTQTPSTAPSAIPTTQQHTQQSSRALWKPNRPHPKPNHTPTSTPTSPRALPNQLVAHARLFSYILLHPRVNQRPSRVLKHTFSSCTSTPTYIIKIAHLLPPKYKKLPHLFEYFDLKLPFLIVVCLSFELFDNKPSIFRIDAC